MIAETHLYQIHKMGMIHLKVCT